MFSSQMAFKGSRETLKPTIEGTNWPGTWHQEADAGELGKRETKRRLKTPKKGGRLAGEPASKSGNLSLTPEPHMEGEENQL